MISWMLFAASTMHGSRARGSDHVPSRRPTEGSVTANGLSAATRLPTHLFRVNWRFRPGIDAARGTYPALEALHERMLARPSVQKALAIEKSYG